MIKAQALCRKYEITYPSPINNFKNNFNLDDQLRLQNQNYTRFDRLSILRFDYLGLISQNNVIPPQSHFAAIRFNIPQLTEKFIKI